MVARMFRLTPHLSALALTCAAVSLAAEPRAELPKLLVLDLTAGGVGPEIASALTDAAAAEISARGFFQVVTSRDLQTLIGLERQKQLLGCSEEAGSCLAELGGALGAKVVLSGSVTRLGPNLQLNLQALDSSRAQPLGRTTRIAPDIDPLRRALPYAVAEVLGIPSPAPPSRVVPYSLMGGGAVAVLAGAGMGVIAFAQEEAFLRELELGSRQQGILENAESYRQEASRIGILKTASLATAIVGVGLGVAGFLLNPASLAEGSGPRAVVVTDGSSSALVLGGVW